MKTALIQTSLFWENPNNNRQYLSDKINSISQYVDLIVLPEMFSSGFTMNPQRVAETMDGPTVNWMKEKARNRDCALTGSVVITEKGNFYNRLLFVHPNGKTEWYDKRHLFTLAGEDKVYTSGKHKLIVDYKGFKICPLICYDLRFPVFSRNVEEYDVLLYVANWPQTRINTWDILLKARAVENMSYVLGVNRVGTDGSNLEYVGHSQAIDFLGNFIQEPNEKEEIFIVELKKDPLRNTRKKLAFLNDRDTFEIL